MWPLIQAGNVGLVQQTVRRNNCIPKDNHHILVTTWVDILQRDEKKGYEVCVM